MGDQLFKNKYRIKSIRLQHWDYSSCGVYYVTICTKGRECFFGKIINGKMILSEIGEMVVQFWMEIPKHYPHVKLDEFVIMPDHLHGVLIIQTIARNVETPHWGVSTGHIPNPHHNPRWKPNSLGSIICQFKSISTKRIRAMDFLNFAWQSRFYESIVRNEKHLYVIRKYIINNPLKFELDKKRDYLKPPY